MLASPSVPEYAAYPRDALWDALRDIEDPEMGISVVDLGLIVSVEQTGNEVGVRITYTAMGCPATEMIEGDIAERLRRVPGIEHVAIDVVWDPIWTKARLTEDACDALRLLGVAV